MPFDPRQIPNNFRLQSLIEEGLRSAEALLATREIETLSPAELTDLALIYMESGNRTETQKYTGLALEAEKAGAVLSKETKATLLYVIATFKREDNHCDEALQDFGTVLELAQSDWLKSNLLRNMGLAYLKLQNFAEATERFQSAYDLTLASEDKDLRGALPALLNYVALCTARGELTTQQEPQQGFNKFSEAGTLYASIFNEKGINDQRVRRRSHDYISHCVHRAMIICEAYEKSPSLESEVHLRNAEYTLLEALQSRIENKADGQRLGDVCTWLGRTYALLKENEVAKKWFRDAEAHYLTVLPSTSKQVQDVKARVTNLSFVAVPIHSLVTNSAVNSLPKQGSKLDTIAEESNATLGDELQPTSKMANNF